MSDYMAWADNTASDMRAFYDDNRPRTFMEKLFGKRSTSPGIIADDLMLGLMNIVLEAKAARDREATQ